MASTQLNNVQKNTVTLQILDPRGLGRDVDGVPVWSVEDPSVLDVVPTPDGFGATFSTTGVVGETRVFVSADVDLGPDTQTVTGFFDVTVTDSGEVTFNFTFGTPTRR